ERHLAGLVCVQMHVGGCAWFLRCFVEAAVYFCGKDKVILEMWDVLEEDRVVIERDVIEEHQMLMQLAHVAYVGHDRQSEFLRHQAYGEKLAHASKPGAIGLDEVQASVVEEVFKENAVG